MVERNETSALLDVRHRLERTFPGVASTVVQQVVADSYGAMTGPIRDFVPLLVEHQARDVLAASVRAGRSRRRESMNDDEPVTCAVTSRPAAHP